MLMLKLTIARLGNAWSHLAMLLLSVIEWGVGALCAESRERSALPACHFPRGANRDFGYAGLCRRQGASRGTENSKMEEMPLLRW
jgi:hypothetical protein